MLDPEEEKQLVARAKEGDMVAFRALYDANLKRVIAHVGRIMGPGSEVEDVGDDRRPTGCRPSEL